MGYYRAVLLNKKLFKCSRENWPLLCTISHAKLLMGHIVLCIPGVQNEPQMIVSVSLLPTFVPVYSPRLSARAQVSQPQHYANQEFTCPRSTASGLIYLRHFYLPETCLRQSLHLSFSSPSLDPFASSPPLYSLR